MCAFVNYFRKSLLLNQQSVTNRFLRGEAGTKLALTMRSLISLCIVCAIFGAAASLSLAQKAARTPVLVELFTSEGCETCPPADKYLQRLLQEQPVGGVEIIAMAEHVDYWNRLGWTDPFSSPLFSQRQKYYAGFLKHDSVYTPQIIVNGTRELRGKDGTMPIEDAAKDPTGSIKLSIESAGEDAVSIGLKITKLLDIANGDHAVVMIAITEDDLSSNVLRGENSGRKLKHMAVARSLHSYRPSFGEETIVAANLTLGTDWKRDELSVVAFVQEVESRRVLASARIKLKQ